MYNNCNHSDGRGCRIQIVNNFLGSWDYTIRVWDTRDGTCLDTVCDHGADVYGKTEQHLDFY